MKTFATLLAILAIAAGANAADFSSTGSGVETTIVTAGDDTCTQTLYVNHDGSFENGYCWQYGGIVPPTYGAFGEGFSLGGGCIECIAIWATQVGNYFGQTCDTYVWDGGVTGVPGNVLWTATGQAFTNIGFWPTLTQNDFACGYQVAGDFTVGYWADFSAMVCGWFIGADQNGFGGYPWSNIAPGIGYPTGWQNPTVIWGTTQSLGFGVYFEEGGTSPVEAATWGEIKDLF
jgi:hypothetical protein